MPTSEVRTEIVLDRKIHAALERSAAARAISVMQLIREAVEAYVRSSESDLIIVPDDAVADDPVWQLGEIAARIGAEGPGDAAERHDDYLYGPGYRPDP